MNDRELSTLIWLRVRDIVKLMLQGANIKAEKAFSIIYKSKMFELLSDEKTKIWHYSANMLHYILQNELKTGIVDLPEAQF